MAIDNRLCAKYLRVMKSAGFDKNKLKIRIFVLFGVGSFLKIHSSIYSLNPNAFISIDEWAVYVSFQKTGKQTLPAKSSEMMVKKMDMTKRT